MHLHTSSHTLVQYRVYRVYRDKHCLDNILEHLTDFQYPSFDDAPRFIRLAFVRERTDELEHEYVLQGSLGSRRRTIRRL